MKLLQLTADIEQMLHNFIVREDRDICEYRLTVHVFGNSSSLSVAIYGLRHAADHNEKEFESDA